ncbi:hypothetical protein PY092_19020 [Muricauda sp. 334s03]|uniref:Lipocalin-like domain-containing protein n=1 Tax=Flagellimonas yonaguniensis TaxID=3031325 RepID=A0ABT5Y496_9FLAO|nr:hypothetical protein [[Muricauda] yonaguniensis]MDF0718262.1 hypothetical protein [[Muricauda] yonaguniensis]
MNYNKILKAIMILLVPLHMVFGQNKDETSLVLGEWSAYKKTDLDGGDGSDMTLNGQPYTVKLELLFLDNGRSYFNNGEGKIETSYSLKGDTLKISRFTYSIFNASSDELVLKEEEFLGKLIYLKRVRENQRPNK